MTAGNMTAGNITFTNLYGRTTTSTITAAGLITAGTITCGNMTAGNITFTNLYASGAGSVFATSGAVYAATLTASGIIKALSFNATSDYRVKNNVKEIRDEFTIKHLRPVYYDNTLSKRTEMGFIAHEVQEQFPFLVNGEKDGSSMQSLNYIGLIPLLVKEVQDLKAEIALIKQQIKTQL
jgi:hypothetical protein